MSVFHNCFIFFILIGYDVDVYDKLSQPGGRAQTWTTEWISPKVNLEFFPSFILKRDFITLSYLLLYFYFHFDKSLG